MAKNAEVEGFGRRLREAADRMGFTSSRSKSGVDVVAMSRAMGGSYEMARRYAEGHAMPKLDTVRQLAAWLKVEPAWLMTGEGTKETGKTEAVDTALLEECIAAVADAQMSAGTKLSTDRQAQLVVALYQSAQSGARPSAASVAAVLKALGA